MAAKKWGLVLDGAPAPARHRMLEARDSLSEEQQALESRGMVVYAGIIDDMDYHFGGVVKFLKYIGEYGNTVIVFLSENGANPWKSDDYPGNSGSE
jgi:arylsulfatase